MRKEITLIQYLAGQATSGPLCRVLASLTIAAHRISRELAKMTLHSDGMQHRNIHGEQQHALDRLANQAFKSALSGVIYLSEEEPEPLLLGQVIPGESLIVAVDPLDGSANIGLNLPLGSIFSVYPSADGLLQTGSALLAAGYILYGTQTLLVLACGGTVNAFTLDQTSGSFLLSHPTIRLPEHGRSYAVNEGALPAFSPGMQRFIGSLKVRDLALRYTACLVADVHRILFEGGIYLYPSTTAYPEGKLRLVYEGHPLAFVLQTAGGAASNGRQTLLELRPDSVHQRTPLLIGSKELVAEAAAETILTYETT